MTKSWSQHHSIMELEGKQIGRQTAIPSGVDRDDVEYVQDCAKHDSPLLSRRDSSHGRYERNRSEAKISGDRQQSESGLAGVSKWPWTRNKSWQRKTFLYRLCGGIRALPLGQVSEPGSRTIPTADGQNKPARFAPGDPIGMPSMSGAYKSAEKPSSINLKNCRAGVPVRTAHCRAGSGRRH